MKIDYFCKTLLLLFLITLISSVNGEISTSTESGFGEVVFCEDISPGGDPLYISDTFSQSASEVFVYIPYSNMKDGENWGMFWTVNGDEYADERDQIWQEGPDGWITYDVTNDGILLEGIWELFLYRGEELVQVTQFTITPDLESPPVQEESTYEVDNAGFGRIRFAEEVTKEQVPIRQSDQFETGIREVYFVAPYFGMNDGLFWTREWLLDDEEFITGEDIWSEGKEGIISRSMGYEDDIPLNPGTYTLNLYIEGQLARSASFTIKNPDEKLIEDNPRIKPEDLIDEELLPAWEMLQNSPTEVVREIANLALENQIEIRLVDEGNAIAWYRYSKGSAEIGDISVKRSKYNQYLWVEVASTIAHELTHAMQHKEQGANLHCSVENEYYAYIVELYVLLDNGRKDLIYENWSGLFDDNWGFDSGKLWSALKEAYNTCPEY